MDTSAGGALNQRRLFLKIHSLLDLRQNQRSIFVSLKISSMVRGVYFVLRRPRRNLFCLQAVSTRYNEAADLSLFDQSRRRCCQPANAAKLSKTTNYSPLAHFPSRMSTVAADIASETEGQPSQCFSKNGRVAHQRALCARDTAVGIKGRQLSKNYAPFGRLIPSELIVTVDSSSIQTPIIGLVTEDICHNGRLIIPAGTEVHGNAQKRWQRASFLPATVWTRQRPAARHGRPKSLHKFAQIPGREFGLHKVCTADFLAHVLHAAFLPRDFPQRHRLYLKLLDILVTVWAMKTLK